MTARMRTRRVAAMVLGAAVLLVVAAAGAEAAPASHEHQVRMLDLANANERTLAAAAHYAAAQEAARERAWLAEQAELDREHQLELERLRIIGTVTLAQFRLAEALVVAGADPDRVMAELQLLLEDLAEVMQEVGE